MVEPTREYGFRDLGILQDLRRQYLQRDFAWRTNELAMAFEVFNLRQSRKSPAASDELDRIFTNLVSGKISAAREKLSTLAK